MAGIISHNYIIYKALKTYNTDLSEIKKVKDSHDKVTKLAQTEAGVEKYGSSNKHYSSSFAYIGAFGPDFFYMKMESEPGGFIANLMHYNKTGPYILYLLSYLKKNKLLIGELKSKMLYYFAYLLGHASHIAADITIHPFVNSIVGAYHDNLKLFEHARGWVRKNEWRFHNILEQYQDTYVLYEKFFKEENFYHKQAGNCLWSPNIAYIASDYLLKNKHNYFMLKFSKDFYNYSEVLDSKWETKKYQFFTCKNWFMDIDYYYTTTTPDKNTMKNCKILVQEELFDQYLEKAIQITKEMWREIEIYWKSSIVDTQEAISNGYFNKLSRHWNLDTGFSPEIIANPLTWQKKDREGEPDLYVHIPCTLCYKNIHRNEIDDVE